MSPTAESVTVDGATVVVVVGGAVVVDDDVVVVDVVSPEPRRVKVSDPMSASTSPVDVTVIQRTRRRGDPSS